MEVFIRRLLSKQIASGLKTFRGKLLDDCDTGGLELADFLVDTPVATVSTYELRKLSLSDSTSNSFTQNDHAAGVSQATGSEGTISATSHSSSVTHTSSFEDSGSTATLSARKYAEIYVLHKAYAAAPSDAPQHWTGCAADVRLVVSVLMQHASNGLCQQQLRHLLQSTSWSEACQHCKDTLLICALLHHYFPHAVDLQQLSAAASTNSSLAHDAAPAVAVAGPDSVVCNSVKKQQHDPLQHPHNESKKGSSEQQPAPSNHSELFLDAAAAAGVPLPAGCSVSSIAAGDPLQLLQLLTAIVVTGEMQQLLQEECSIPLQATAAAAAAQQLSQRQQQDCKAVSLLRAWLAVMSDVQRQMGCVFFVQDAGDSTTTVQHEDANQCQLQLLQADVSWQNVLDVLLHLQQTQQQHRHTVGSDVLTPKHESSIQQSAAAWHDPLTPIHDKPQSNATNFDRCTNDHHSGASRRRHSSSSDGSVSSSSNNGSQNVLQQLSQLGCNMPLLQHDDLQDNFMHSCAMGAPIDSQPLQLVLLMRLIYSTRHLWIPVIQQQPQQQVDEEQLGLAAYVVPLLQLQQQQQHSATASSCSDHGITPSDSEVPSADVAQAVGALNDGGQAEATGDQLGCAVSNGSTSPRNSWPPELLTTSQLWPGDEDEMDDVFTREERTLRCWINSLLHRTGAGGSSSGVGSRRGSGSGSGVGGSGGGAEQHCGAARTASAVLEHESCSWDDLKSVLSGTATAGCAGSATAAALPDASEAAVTAPATPTIGKRTSRISRSSSDAGPQQHQQHQANGGMFCRTAAGSPCQFSFSSISSLFGAEVRSGVLLLELLDHLQPGCVDWKLANKLPFKMGAAAQLLALENCQLALKTAQEDLGLPLVSMSPRDVVLGRRKIILSLVYQLMRYHTMQLLERIATGQQQQQPVATMLAAGLGCDSATAAAGVNSPSVTPRAAAATGRVKIFSSSKKQRRQLAITEQDILDWANSKLQQVQPLCAADGVNGVGAEASTAAENAANGTADSSTSKMATLHGGSAEQAAQHQQQLHGVGGPSPVARPVVTSFRDPVLASGLVLLQLLHVMDPEAVDLSFVTAGLTREQRQSNAKYALSVADRMGCSLFLVWEDLVDLQPRMVLVLLASLMYLDQTKQRQQQVDSAQGP